MTTQTQHTPGPWTEHEGFICGRFSDGNVYDICDPRCAPAELFEEIDANARLIAASPDLLTALEWSMRCMGDYLSADSQEGRDHCYQDLAHAHREAIKAIAKAKGAA